MSGSELPDFLDERLKRRTGVAFGRIDCRKGRKRNVGGTRGPDGAENGVAAAHDGSFPIRSRKLSLGIAGNSRWTPQRFQAP